MTGIWNNKTSIRDRPENAQPEVGAIANVDTAVERTEGRTSGRRRARADEHPAGDSGMRHLAPTFNPTCVVLFAITAYTICVSCIITYRNT